MRKNGYKNEEEEYEGYPDENGRRGLHIAIFALAVGIVTLAVCFFIVRGNGSQQAPVPSSPLPSKSTETSAPPTTSLSSNAEETTTASETLVPTEEESDPREDVLTHYTNLAIVTDVNNYLNVRDEPTTEGNIIGKLLKHSGMEILEDMGNGWYQIQSGDVTGYVGAEFVSTGDEAKKLAVEYCVPMIEVSAERLNVRSGPGLEYDVWTQLNSSELYEVEEDMGEWYKIIVNNTPGYISKEYVTEGYYLPEAISWSAIDNVTGIRRQLIDWGVQYLGVPYVYGGTDFNTGVDCSYFTMSCYNSVGISLMRTSREQATQGREIALSEALPGDLLFYADDQGIIDHVAIYIGDGKILHAANSFHQVVISTYNYMTEPVAVRRYIED